MSPEELETFLPYTESFNWPMEKRIEVIHTVWGLMESVIEQAHGTHPVQLSCEHLEAGNLQSHNPDQVSNSKKPTLH